VGAEGLAVDPDARPGDPRRAGEEALRPARPAEQRPGCDMDRAEDAEQRKQAGNAQRRPRVQANARWLSGRGRG